MDQTQEDLILIALNPSKNQPISQVMEKWLAKMKRLADNLGVDSIKELHEDFDVRIQEMQKDGADDRVIKRLKGLKLHLKSEIESRGSEVIPVKKRKSKPWGVMIPHAVAG